MAVQRFAGFVYTGAGVAVVGATVDIFTRNTLTAAVTVPASITTDANGYWSATVAAEGRFDVRVTNGTSVLWLKYDDELQITTIEVNTLRVRNPAFTFDYDIVPAAITADRQITLPLLTGTGTPAVLENVVSGGQTFASALTLSALLTVNANIAFPATQVADAGANVLDDYEEGSWTPTIAFGGASVGVTYSVQVGRYTKIGNRVMLHCFVTLTSKGTSTGAATVGGLPFTVNNIANSYGASSLRLNNVSYTGAFQGYFDVNTTNVVLEKATEAGLVSALDDTNFSNASAVIIQGTYQV